MMPGEVTLAIETSQRTASVALSRADGSVDHESLRATSRHEDDLMPAIDRLCRRNELAPRDLSAVAVSIGPGGFTGLRIAVSTAKMLAESLGVKLVAVPSALVAAESIKDDGPLLVCLASKRQSTWVTRLERADGDWRIVGTPGLVAADDVDLTGVTVVVADEFLPESIRLLLEQSTCAIALPQFDARACLAVAQRMIRADRIIDSVSLIPLYARPPEAVRLWESRNPA